MKTSDFYYDLPQELIAQHPIEPRDASRLLVMDRASGEIQHRHFRDVLDYLTPDDCLILNDSRVLPARIFGVKEGGESVNEFLLLTQKEQKVWECLTKPGKRARVGTRFVFGEGLMTGEVMEVLDDGNRIVRFDCEDEFFSVLDRIGQMPLPPYITEKLEDKERYQTVYARELGSAAAPTAGLHFTNELLQKIRAKGVKIGYVTLHVGLGTFRPVKVDDVNNHVMHSEHYCVGTTSCRTLESCPVVDGQIQPDDGWTQIFIYPGYSFKVIDGLITNFHLPESTLIMLVSAFAGYDHVMNAYKIAVEEKYRFFSFGDACMIV